MIKDKDINYGNYANFKKCDFLMHGTIIKFTMACDICYKVPIEYFLKWFSDPHYILCNGELVQWDETKCNKKILNKLVFISGEHILNNTAIRIYLNDNTVYDVSWDTVLMACERSYEHFGGLTNESKKIVNEWLQSEEPDVGRKIGKQMDILK
jgi:hypothetical protein